MSSKSYESYYRVLVRRTPVLSVEFRCLNKNAVTEAYFYKWSQFKFSQTAIEIQWRFT